MKKRILVVEDEKDLADTIKLNLELEEYHPIVVHDGLDAIAALYISLGSCNYFWFTYNVWCN